MGNITLSFGQDSILSNPTIGVDNKIYNEITLQNFFAKLKEVKSNGRQVNILQLGDSHMQMGYFVEEMRANFLHEFGLSGIGTIFPYPIANYRPFYVKAKVVNGTWKGSNYLNAESDIKYGMAGFTLKTTSRKAGIEIMPQKSPQEIQTGNQVVLFYQANDNAVIDVSGIDTFTDSTKVFKSINVLNSKESDSALGWKKAIFYFEKGVNKINVSINQLHDTAAFYINGLQLNNVNKAGIVYNNCGVGGAQFSHLCNHSSYSVEQIKDLNPDLIIFSYGSNESYTSTFNSEAYQKMVGAYLDKIKAALPGVAIILTAPPDTRSKGRFPVNSMSIGMVFNKLASEKQVAYWDLCHQMGGSGSLLKWLQLGLASTDKLHFTKLGYQLQAKMLIEAIFNAYNKTVTVDQQIKLPVINRNFK